MAFLNNGATILAPTDVPLGGKTLPLRPMAWESSQLLSQRQPLAVPVLAAHERKL